MGHPKLYLPYRFDFKMVEVSCQRFLEASFIKCKMNEKPNDCRFKAAKKERNRLDKYKSIRKTKRKVSFRGNKNVNEPDLSGGSF